jgi:hypothetical protein
MIRKDVLMSKPTDHPINSPNETEPKPSPALERVKADKKTREGHHTIFGSLEHRESIFKKPMGLLGTFKKPR